MKYYTEKENNEILALSTLADSDNEEIADFAIKALEDIPSVGVEVIIDGETIIDERAMDDDSILADYIVAYDEYIAKHIDSTEDYNINIDMINLYTGEIVFSAKHEVYNKGEATCMSEWCSRKSLREMI